MSGIHLFSRLEAFFNLTIKTARRIPATETAARRFGIFLSSVGPLMTAIVRRSYCLPATRRRGSGDKLFASGFCNLRKLQRWKSTSHHSLDLGGLIIGQYPLPLFQRQQTPGSRDTPRLNGQNRARSGPSERPPYKPSNPGELFEALAHRLVLRAAFRCGTIIVAAKPGKL